jgi:DNA invertase Pin-like site-specific DNA recombinase
MRATRMSISKRNDGERIAGIRSSARLDHHAGVHRRRRIGLKRFPRPALNQLMTDAGRRKFDAVLVWKLERYGCDLNFLYYLTNSEMFRQRLDSVVQSVTRSHQRANPEQISFASQCKVARALRLTVCPTSFRANSFLQIY